VAIWCEETDNSYLVPSEFLSRVTLHLRVNAPKKNSSSLILWAKDFCLDSILAKNTLKS
jgi:hypothetical protein